jgi:hypothetical protein
MDSYFASPERDNDDDIYQDYKYLQSVKYLEDLINAMPVLSVILNKHRQILLANKQLLDKLGLKAIESILGKRPGEAIHCINAGICKGECGVTLNCSVCGAVRCIQECLQTQKESSGECLITSFVSNEYVSYDFKANAYPLFWNNEQYVLFTLVDISAEKRKLALERTFFHDVLNKIGNLEGLIYLLKRDKNSESYDGYISVLESVCKDLSLEINAQRELSKAESGDISVEKRSYSSLDILRNVAKQIQANGILKNKELEIDPNAEDIYLLTDWVLISRIITNMLKNAFEAEPDGAIIRCGANKTEAGKVRFWVKNDSEIPADVQKQIFYRSFSTKGNDRGLGTYSMRLLGERYLKGKVGFTSTEKEDTCFFIDLDL